MAMLKWVSVVVSANLETSLIAIIIDLRCLWSVTNTITVTTINY